MISYNENNDEFCLQMDNASILGQPEKENDYLIKIERFL